MSRRHALEVAAPNPRFRPFPAVVGYVIKGVNEHGAHLDVDVDIHPLRGPAVAPTESIGILSKTSAQPLAAIRQSVDRNTQVLHPDRNMRIEPVDEAADRMGIPLNDRSVCARWRNGARRHNGYLPKAC